MIRSRTRNSVALLLTTLLTLALLGGTLAGCSIPGFGDDNETEQPTPEPEPDPQATEPATDDTTLPDASDDAGEVDAVEEEPVPEAVRIVEATLQEPRTLNPILVSDPVSEEISRMVFSGLVMVNPETGEPEPDLAESWEIDEDGLRVRFRLRDDLVWHDGQPLTARDVQFTYELMMNDETRSPRYSRLVERLRSVQAINEETVEFNLIAPYAPFLSTLATFGIVPQHVLRDVLPSELVTDLFGTSVAIGSGPFRLAFWQRGDRIVLDANRDFHRTQPQIDVYELWIAVDEEEILSGLEAGYIDWAMISPSNMDEASQLPGVQTHSVPGFGMIAIFLQLEPEQFDLFQDSRIRQALMLALDRQTLLEQIWHGHGEIAHGTLPPASWAYRHSDHQYSFDTTRAGELLTDAGWATSDDGIRMKDGMPLQFHLITNGDNPQRRDIAELVVRQWRDVGIDARVMYETWASVRHRVTTTREFEALLLGYQWDLDPDQHAVWSSDSIPDAFNLGGYFNLEVDRLLDDAQRHEDSEIRAEHYANMQNLVMTDLPVLPLVFPNLTLATGPRLQGVEVPAILVRNRATIVEWIPVAAEQQ